MSKDGSPTSRAETRVLNKFNVLKESTGGLVGADDAVNATDKEGCGRGWMFATSKIRVRVTIRVTTHRWAADR